MGLSNIPLIKIGNLEFNIMLGGMGIGISEEKLPVAVAEEGGAGTIAAVELGTLKDDPIKYLKTIREDPQKYIKANKEAFRETIRAARKRTNGVIGANIMHALVDYTGLVETAIDEDVDYIASGAGVAKDLAKYLKGKNIKLFPIVGSGRLAGTMCQAWSKYNHLPDAIIVEGPKAGGHLGYGRYNPNKPDFMDHLDNSNFVEHGLEKIILEVIMAVKPYEESSGEKIPVIAAGGIYYGGDIKKFIELGAAGAQMATRFVTTNECDADIRFKQTYLNCNKEDIVLIDSPVGMPGRAINNKFLEEVNLGKRTPANCPYHCLKTCKMNESPYCIARALIEAQQGKFDNGFVFCGSNAWRTKEDGIITVKELFKKLNQEYAANKRSD